MNDRQDGREDEDERVLPAPAREPVTHQLEGHFVIDLDKLGDAGEDE